IRGRRVYVTLVGLMRCKYALILWLAAVLPLGAQTQTLLDQSFRAMYNLRFDDARRLAAEQRRLHPPDPLADVAEASALLFSEFDRLKILQSEFFSSDERFDERKKQTADPEVRARFDAALGHAEMKAQSLLTKNAQDKDALFALSLVNGLRADYAALIE